MFLRTFKIFTTNNSKTKCHQQWQILHTHATVYFQTSAKVFVCWIISDLINQITLQDAYLRGEEKWSFPLRFNAKQYQLWSFWSVPQYGAEVSMATEFNRRYCRAEILIRKFLSSSRDLLNIQYFYWKHKQFKNYNVHLRVLKRKKKWPTLEFSHVNTFFLQALAVFKSHITLSVTHC